VKHQTNIIKRCQALPHLLLRAFLLGLLLTESLTVIVGLGLPIAAAHPQWSRAPKGKDKADLFISESHLGGDHFQVGDDVTFIIVVGNNSRTRLTTSITVSDAIPIGMHNLQARGHDWNIAMSHTKSPAVITATYRGKDSINGGETLPAIEISGVLTKDAISSLTNVVRVNTGCNCKVSNNSSTDTISVKECSRSRKCGTYSYKKIHKGGNNKGKSDNSSQENTSTTNLATNTPAPTNTAANAVSAVAITSVNINNIYGANGVGTLPAFNSGSIYGFNSNAGITSDPSNVGGVPGLPNTVPGLPNTGSDPRGSLTAGTEE
jgi:uncharacterized repeat protein (TIGR01451 family)